MPESGRIDAPSDESKPIVPTDGFLIASMVGGDSTALSALMNRYDRLVRYTIFQANRDQCRKDPQWLETIASDTWVGFIRSMKRNSGTTPESLPAYLTQIARNQWITAGRRAKGAKESLPTMPEDEALNLAASIEEPGALMVQVEGLTSLRDCVSKLDGASQEMFSQLTAITERRWRDAASALGMRESTLRSRWKVVLERLRRCLRRFE